MKRALWLIGCCVLSGTSALVARGDNSSSAPTTAPLDAKPPAGPMAAQPVNTLPPVYLMPSLIPTEIDMSTSDDPEHIAEQTLALNKMKRDNPPDLVALAEVQKKEADDHDWMLRGYQEQLKKNGLEKAPAPDPYALPTRDAVTGKLTDPLIDAVMSPATDDNSKTPFRRTDDNDPDKDKVTSTTTTQPTSYFSLPPMLPPLDAPGSTPSTKVNYLSDTPAASDPSSTVLITLPAIPPDPSLQDSALDIPGMTAANNGPTASGYDLNIVDPLPDEPANSSRPIRDQNTFRLPENPLSNSEAFFKKQREALEAPNAPTFRGLVTPPTVTAIPYEPPKPRQSPPTGLRNHVADPFDYLLR